VTVEKDGSYVLEVPYSEDRELVMEILRYGSDVAVIAPDNLRVRIENALAEAAQQYK
jgi:predicted DNA-binding transcriptional regulator YafY